MQFFYGWSLRRKTTGILISLCVLTGCATSLTPSVVSPVEQIKRDRTAGMELARDLESKLSFKKDIEVAVYLRGLAERMVQGKADLADSPIGIFVIQDPKSRWWNLGLPGNRVYLSVGFLKEIEFENELAAAIALQLTHIQKRHAVARWQEQQNLRVSFKGQGSSLEDQWREGDSKAFYPTRQNADAQSVDYFGSIGVFSFSDSERLSAIEGAVDLLYKAGFDPRGLVSLWLKYQNNPRKSPYERDTLMKLLERSREAIALHAPLLNPVVRSEAFLKIRKRMQGL